MVFKNSKINLNSDVIKKIIEEFMQKKIYPAHVPIFSLKPKDKFDKIKSSPFGTYDQLDIIKNPILFRIITDNEILDYAIKYFAVSQLYLTLICIGLLKVTKSLVLKIIIEISMITKY